MQITRKLIAGILIGSLILAWLVASLSLVVFIKKKKGYEAIRFSDIALPWNWDEVQPKWGDYFITKGIEHQGQGEWQQAYHFIRIGVSKSPSNLEGRLALADFLFQANDVAQAVNILETGIEYALQDEEFWNKLINFLQYYHADREIIRILGHALDEGGVPPKQIGIAESALAKAHYHQANFAEVLSIFGKKPGISNQLLRAQIYWDQGLENLAIQNLEALNSMLPNQREVVPLLTKFYKQSGDIDAALKLSKFTYLNNPYSVGATMNYLRTTGENFSTEIERFLARVPEIFENKDALFLLVNFLSEIGIHEKLDEVITQSKPDFQNDPMIWFLRLESLVNGSSYDQAIELLKAPPSSINQLIPLHRILFNSLSLASYYAVGDTGKGKISMQQLFNSGHIRPETLLRLTRKLIEIERPEEAGRVLQFLLQQNPGNHAALVEKIRIDLRTGNFEEAIKLSQTMVINRTMPFELKKELVEGLTTDKQIYHTEVAPLIRQLLDTMTPTKKKRLLEVL